MLEASRSNCRSGIQLDRKDFGMVLIIPDLVMRQLFTKVFIGRNPWRLESYQFMINLCTLKESPVSSLILIVLWLFDHKFVVSWSSKASKAPFTLALIVLNIIEIRHFINKRAMLRQLEESLVVTYLKTCTHTLWLFLKFSLFHGAFIAHQNC